MKVRELAKLLTEGGWEYVGSTGSHHRYKHPKLSGKLTIPGNPNRDIKVGTLNRLLKRAVIK
ncbi:MAG: type II toxin-antitoxin system HicA family toxin [SAR324 cluster bacterium]|nr:type II toxin-antitoxin system HicA family toxin [SAR324 cluster bacterium]